jgi:hypothetical protein
MNTTKKMRFYLLLIVWSLLYSCKHDQAEFAMHDHQFIDSVYPEMQYQQQLNFEMQKILGRIDVNNMGYKRSEHNQSYIKELLANTDVHGQFTLNERHINNLVLLRRQDPVMFAELQSLLIDSDQRMIGFHVKASGSTGLINADLRNWAEKKLHYWITDLKEVQDLTK